MKKRNIKDNFDCKHQWAPLIAKVGKKTLPTLLFTCIKCGDLKIGTHTIKISKYRLDIDEKPIKNTGEIALKFEPTSDVTASGLVVTATVDTNTSGIGSPLMMAADGHFDDADADASTTSPAVVLALETGTGSKKVLVHGILRNDAWGWTTGPGKSSLIYVSTTAGTLTQTQPSGTDDVVQPVGWALSDDVIYFCPSLIYFTHT